MLTGTYKLPSVARPGHYIALSELSVIGHSDTGLVNEWFAQFEADDLPVASLRAVRPGAISDLFISYDSETGTLKVSKEPFYFAIKPTPGGQSPFISIEVPGIHKVFALTSWDDGAPIELQPNTGSTQQLWLFNKVVESADSE